jgi:hypothetical protein
MSQGFKKAEFITIVLLHTMNVSKRTDAIVVDIDVGVKGGKKAVLQFSTNSGRSVKSHDLFRMYLIRHHQGDRVTVVYDPADEKTVTVDLGPWA